MEAKKLKKHTALPLATHNIPSKPDKNFFSYSANRQTDRTIERRIFFLLKLVFLHVLRNSKLIFFFSITILFLTRKVKIKINSKTNKNNDLRRFFKTLQLLYRNFLIMFSIFEIITRSDTYNTVYICM